MASTDSKFLGEGLTYDDVLLVPNYSEVLPRDVQLHAPFSRNIQLKTPIVSAAMDTVTESKMAIAMARAGGIGVVHKNMTIAAQANEVRKVKRSESGMIQDPVTLSKDATAGDALAIMREHKIGGIPVTDDAGKLVGIVTNRDLRFEKQGRPPHRRAHDERQPHRHGRWKRPLQRRSKSFANTALKSFPLWMATASSWVLSPTATSSN